MKLQALHLFLILLGSLILCSMLTNTIEGLTSSKEKNVDIQLPSKAQNRVINAPATSDVVNPLLQDEGDSSYITPPPQSIISGDGYGDPLGVSHSQIAPGDEDLYILKSEVIPPVCPICPSNSSCPRAKPCPPCPPCARCPEPAFECKKVPNYRNNESGYLPRPVLNSFSQFGM